MPVSGLQRESDVLTKSIAACIIQAVERKLWGPGGPGSAPAEVAARVSSCLKRIQSLVHSNLQVVVNDQLFTAGRAGDALKPENLRMLMDKSLQR